MIGSPHGGGDDGRLFRPGNCHTHRRHPVPHPPPSSRPPSRDPVRCLCPSVTASVWHSCGLAARVQFGQGRWKPLCSSASTTCQRSFIPPAENRIPLHRTLRTQGEPVAPAVVNITKSQFLRRPMRRADTRLRRFIFIQTGSGKPCRQIAKRRIDLRLGDKRIAPQILRKPGDALSVNPCRTLSSHPVDRGCSGHSRE